ncbi:MAG: carboxypeptidase regulatory-like domain-containing protein [Myxococcales bacterium]|nr:carboxypeptidase regulatory-like domain-containing protein [Myxococcales bacterium]
MPLHHPSDRRRTVSLLVPLALALVACSGGGATSDASDAGSEASSSGAASSGGESTGSAGTGTDTGGEGTGSTGAGAVVDVSGDAFAFGPATMVSGATVTILEQPGVSTVTDDDGHFAFEGLPAGSEATFVFNRSGYPTIYTRTFTLPDADAGPLERVTFQAPDDSTFAALAFIVEIDPDPATCQIASTVTRIGVSLYDGVAHGEAGATVTITPALPPEHGPVYFNANVIPQKDLVETSADGGVLYTNVPPGTYVLRASKAGVNFDEVTVRCDADVLVNPSPPWGLQARP